MELYPLRVEWIPGLPQIPYRKGVGAWEGVVMHHIGTCSESADAQRAYEVGTFQNAFVHEFIDYDDCLQVADPNYIAYGAGGVANKRYIHLELCSADTQEEFDASYDRWCQRAAVHLYNAKLGVRQAQTDGTGTLWSHWDVSRYLGNSNHTDPIGYLKSWGKTWDSVIQRVQQHYDAITKGENLEMEIKYATILIGLAKAAWREGVTKIELEDGSMQDIQEQDIEEAANAARLASGQQEQ